MERDSVSPAVLYVASITPKLPFAEFPEADLHHILYFKISSSIFCESLGLGKIPRLRGD
jgi:hypothetical protein